ncbi:hypothetical protein D3C87_1817390 [compost metagenome]
MVASSRFSLECSVFVQVKGRRLYLSISLEVYPDFHPVSSRNCRWFHRQYHLHLCFPLLVTMRHVVFFQTEFARKYYAILASILDSSLSLTFHRAHSVRSYRSNVTVVQHHIQVFVHEVAPLPFTRCLVIWLLPYYENV